MESVKPFILAVFSLVVLFLDITFILYVSFVVIRLFSFLFSSPKCSNCATRIGDETIRCPCCGISVREAQLQDEPESMNAKVYARVKTLVAEQVGVSEEKLHPDTHLADDLWIDSDDGYELLEAFCEDFEIQNMSEIDHTEYFGTEGFNSLDIYVMLYYLVFDREKLNESVPPLYLRDLVKSAEAKRWIPPEAKF